MKESESMLQYVLPSFSKTQMFISAYRMQVLPPRWKKFARRPKSFPLMSKNNEENVEVLQKLRYYQKNFFLKSSPLITYNSVLTTFPRTFCLKAANVSLILWKRSKRVYNFLQNSVSNEIVPMITHNAILTNLLRNFCHKAQKMFARCPKLM